MADETIVLRNHKDTVFHDLFSDKRNALSLFNALNGTDYRNVPNRNEICMIFIPSSSQCEPSNARNGELSIFAIRKPAYYFLTESTV